LDTSALYQELTLKDTLSSGPGGQHANKTSTKIVLYWSLNDTQVFSEEEVARLRENLKSRLTKDEILILASEHSRSQIRNKEDVVKRFYTIIEAGLYIPKKRKKTKPSKASQRKRLQGKKIHSDKKNNRKKVNF